MATGIEDTFISEPHSSTGRVLDEYALTEHYSRWSEDLDLMRDLKVSASRYGLPWYRISPEKGKWEWGFADDALGRLLDLGIDPIVDLVHYGTPLWMTDSFLHPDYPSYVAEYGSEVATRFKGRIRWYTPLNEPRINAYYAGKLGLWPPHSRGWKGFLAVLTQICKGIVLTSRALEAVDPEIVKCHVDATDIYEPLDRESMPIAEQRQNLVFLALDLVTGKVNDPNYPLSQWLVQNGMSQGDIEWFQAHHIDLDVVGINLYPMFSLKKVSRANGRTKFRMPYAANLTILEKTATLYWDRYHTPLIVTETASAGSVNKRAKWMQESMDACQRLRDVGVPLIGYTWWPMFSLISWSYLSSDRDIGAHVVPMGLWDLDQNLDRMRTPLVDLFASCLTEIKNPTQIQESACVS